jgi:FixJ family two-component response regulator
VTGPPVETPVKEGRRVQGSIISIIDDDVSVRTAVARLLTSMGFGAHTFASAHEFLGSPRLKDTLCIVADVEMPGMSGLELQDHLIAHGAKIPVIFVTGFPDDRIRERAMKGGAVCFLSKPFDEAALLECVERTLKGHDGADDCGPAT